MNVCRVARLACLSLLCGLALGGCSGEEPHVVGPPPDLTEARKFDAYPIYYLGKKAEGFPLTGISDLQYQPRDARSAVWNFAYGDCEPPDGFFAEGGCPLPLSVQNWSICHRWPGMYDPDPRVFDFLGAKAAYTGGLEIFTGRTTVVVFHTSERVSPRKVARLLREVHAAKPPSRLPPPPPGALQGKLPCQDRSRQS